MEDDDSNKDTLSDFVNAGPKKPSRNNNSGNRYRNEDEEVTIKNNRNMRSIQEEEDDLFDQVKKKEWQPRKDFKLSGQPNPLVEYAKEI